MDCRTQLILDLARVTPVKAPQLRGRKKETNGSAMLVSLYLLAFFFPFCKHALMFHCSALCNIDLLGIISKKKQQKTGVHDCG